MRVTPNKFCALMNAKKWMMRPIFSLHWKGHAARSKKIGFWFLAVLGFELGASHLLGRCSKRLPRHGFRGLEVCSVNIKTFLPLSPLLFGTGHSPQILTFFVALMSAAVLFLLFFLVLWLSVVKWSRKKFLYIFKQRKASITVLAMSFCRTRCSTVEGKRGKLWKQGQAKYGGTCL
jgi:hypothetical protein